MPIHQTPWKSKLRPQPNNKVVFVFLWSTAVLDYPGEQFWVVESAAKIAGNLVFRAELRKYWLQNVPSHSPNPPCGILERSPLPDNLSGLTTVVPLCVFMFLAWTVAAPHHPFFLKGNYLES